MTVRVFLLGQPQITRDDAPVPLSIAKAYGVLALLATGVQPRERVMELLWPERAPAVARKNLRNTLWALRRVLADDAVISTAAHLALTGSLWVDVRVFAQTGDLALFRGPLLDGLTFADAPDFEHWLDRERERLLAEYLAGLAERIMRAQAAGEWQRVISLAQRGLAHAPLDEALHRSVMEALARQGQRAAAMEHFAAFQEQLVATLGIAPEPATLALHDSISAGTLTTQQAIMTEPPRMASAAEAAAPFALALSAVLSETAFAHGPYDLPPTPVHGLGQGWLLAWQGDIPGALDSFTAALDAFTAARLPHAIALVCAEIAALHLAQGADAEVAAWLARAKEAAPPTHTAPCLHRLLVTLDGLLQVRHSLAADDRADLLIAAQHFQHQQLPLHQVAARGELGRALVAAGVLAPDILIAAKGIDPASRAALDALQLSRRP